MLMRNCLFHDTDGPGFLLCCYASDGNPNKKISMQNCLINGKSKRPIRIGRAAIFNTTDHTEATWTQCRFYLSPGEALMRVADPEKDKFSKFENCVVKPLSKACSSTNLALKARATAASAVAGSEAAKAVDGNEGTLWKAEGPTGQWLQLVFASPTLINEFRIKEDPSSSISRYLIQCWDQSSKKWVACFNGRGIGADFVAPIISRTTQKVRLMVIQTTAGNPAITEFAAHNDTTGDAFSDPTGAKAPGVEYK
jgi:hypothetical protein